ncbi:hypothetical protein E2C01_097715 [Portunus trituberculatus]|uniref:Uncharacterized protein n=1 Tax=Portunus trituberculatus TaxID=210409 RepID=A0A5B7KC42_PORTR|nr:hypothetical protein [Portunus trituberculatus]
MKPGKLMTSPIMIFYRLIDFWERLRRRLGDLASLPPRKLSVDFYQYGPSISGLPDALTG